MRYVLCTLLIALAGDPAFFQARLERQSGVGTLSGVVETDGSSVRPLRKVVVSLTQTTSSTARNAVTDDSGVFTFDGLPPGRYTLTANRPGYVKVFYGSRYPGRGPGVPVAIASGENVRVRLTMPRGAVIGGTVRATDGRLQSDATVDVRRVTPVNGQRRLEEAAYAFTDDLGTYRVHSLPAGEYVVAARPSVGTAPLRQLDEADISKADAAGRGTQRPVQSAVAPSSVSGSSAVVAYAPSYHRATADLAAAQSVVVKAGEERTDVDVTVALVPVVSLRGRVATPTGEPAPLLNLSILPAASSAGVLLPAVRATTTADGSFTVPNIVPGDYVIVGRSFANENPQSQTMVPSGWLREPVRIAGGDVRDLQITLKPMSTFSGTVVLDSLGSGRSLDLTRLTVVLRAARLSGVEIERSSSSFDLRSRVSADGSFTIRGVMPHSYVAAIPELATESGWTLRSVTDSSRDFADAFVAIQPGENVTNVVATVATDITELTGQVVDAAGKPAAEFPLVVFPVQPSLWSSPRRVRQIRAGTDGTFSAHGLPPGNYYLCVVTDEPLDLTDARLLDVLAAQSITFALAAGDKKRQDFKIVGK
jgi:hypothetical protein